MSARTLNRCAWLALLAWAVFVLLEKRALRAAEDAVQRRNGNGKPLEHELELDLEELTRP